MFHFAKRSFELLTDSLRCNDVVISVRFDGILKSNSLTSITIEIIIKDECLLGILDYSNARFRGHTLKLDFITYRKM